MKKLYAGFIILTMLMSSCGKGGQGELVGVYNKNFKNNRVPLGMVYVPPGRTLIGGSDEDITGSQAPASRMTSFSAFYMDETEITNAEYRQFVNYVRDSVAITSLGPAGAPDLYMPAPTGEGVNANGQRNINWKKVGDGSRLWSSKNGGYASKLADMYYTGDDALFGRAELDVRKFRARDEARRSAI